MTNRLSVHETQFVAHGYEYAGPGAFVVPLMLSLVKFESTAGIPSRFGQLLVRFNFSAVIRSTSSGLAPFVTLFLLVSSISLQPYDIRRRVS